MNLILQNDDGQEIERMDRIEENFSYLGKKASERIISNWVERVLEQDGFIIPLDPQE